MRRKGPSERLNRQEAIGTEWLETGNEAIVADGGGPSYPPSFLLAGASDVVVIY
jgi:hypothetical protein